MARSKGLGMGKPQISPLRCAPPDFLWKPVALRACMRFSLKENRTRGTCLQREAGNPGPVEMTKGRVVIVLNCIQRKNKPQISPLRSR
jgi:hypothetical protein